MIINRASIEALFIGYKSAFQGGFESVQAVDSFYKQIAMEVPSTKSSEVYPWLGAMPRFREWLGPRILNNLRTHDFTIRNRSFENTVAVPRERIEDDEWGVYKPFFKQMGSAAASFPDELLAEAIVLAESALCYDGQFFFDTDHPVLNADGSTSVAVNHGGGAGNRWYLMDLTKEIKPFIFQQRKKPEFVSKDKPTDDDVFDRNQYVYGVDTRCNVGFGLWQMAYLSRQPLTAANYSAARAAMLAFKGDNGRPLNIKPSHLVVGPSNEGAARKLLINDAATGGESNEWKGTAQPIVTQYLT